MKKIILLVCLLVGSTVYADDHWALDIQPMPSFDHVGDKEEEPIIFYRDENLKNLPIANFTGVGSFYICLSSRSRQEAYDYLKTRFNEFPMILAIKGRDNSRHVKYMVLESVEDLPTHSMETACPEDGNGGSCWFIKYEDEK